MGWTYLIVGTRNHEKIRSLSCLLYFSKWSVWIQWFYEWHSALTIGDILIHSQSRLVGPTTGDVSRRVPTASHHHQRNVVATEELDALTVTCKDTVWSQALLIRNWACYRTSESEIEWTESISIEGISSTLKNNCRWLESVHHSSHHLKLVFNNDSQSIISFIYRNLPYRFEDALVGFIGDSISEGHVEWVVTTLACSHILNASRWYRTPSSIMDKPWDLRFLGRILHTCGMIQS